MKPHPFVLRLVALAEAATGLALIVVPSFVGQLLLGVELPGEALTVGRVAGIALVGLAVACWLPTPVTGMLLYSLLVAVYLAILGVTGEATGLLLWPAVMLHLLFAFLLGRAWMAANRA